MRSKNYDLCKKLLTDFELPDREDEPTLYRGANVPNVNEVINIDMNDYTRAVQIQGLNDEELTIITNRIFNSSL